MDRRSFLKTSSMAACALASGSTMGVTEPAAAAAKVAESKIEGRLPGSSLKLSLAAYSFRDVFKRREMSLEDFVDLCAEEGLDGTELTSYYFEQTDRDYLLRLRRRAYVNGLAITGTPLGNDFCLPPGAAREREIAKTKEWIDRVAILGSQTIRIFAGRVPSGGNEEDSRKRAIEGMKEVAEYAGQRGILLGLENHGGITARAEQLLALVTAVDSPWLGVNFDSGNFHHDVYASLERIAPYAVSVQVKIETREEGEKARDTDYPRIVKMLRDNGYRGYVALEYEGRGDPRVEVPKHLAKLRDAMAKTD